MKKEITLEQEDIDHLHDTILEALGGTEDLSNDAVLSVWNTLPEYIQEEAAHWGLSDSVVRDNIYEWLIENVKK
jgi:hypothetical protein